MRNNRPLLSICIPTYNRAKILQKNLINLLNLSSFDDKIELVISDNASTDNTQEIVREFILHYKQKKIIYHRNDYNVKDLNFYIALQKASGLYLKLFNDYTQISDDTLDNFKKYIINNHTNNVNLFFYESIRINDIKYNSHIYVDSIDYFQRIVNNKITWISNFGCWASDLNNLSNLNKYSSTQLLQMIWTLYLVSNKKKTIIVNSKFKCIPIENKVRTPYNFFTPHVLNYYKIINQYYKQNLISSKTIRIDKNRILTDFVGNKIIEYLFLHIDTNFDLSNSWSIIWKHFYKTPYFYQLLLKGVYIKTKRIIKAILRL